MRRREYNARHERTHAGLYRQQIYLPRDEYAQVMSAFNTYMSDEDRQCRVVTKPIGDYYYTIINNGFDDYIVIGKAKIVAEADDIWEAENE